MMGYDDFLQAVSITRQLYSIVGLNPTNLIAVFSGSFPPYWEPLSAVDLEGLVARPLLGNRPDYDDIPLIKANQYTTLCLCPDAAISTDEF